MVSGPIFDKYQGGPSVEVLTTQGSNPVANWKLTGSKPAKKVFEKCVKSYVYECEGGPGCKMQFPRDEMKSFALTQHFLVFQIFLPPGQHFSFEISVSDTERTRRRFNFSTSFTEPKRTPLHCQVPLLWVKHGIWQNLVLDMPLLVERNFRSVSFQSVEQLVLMPVFKLRKVFTLKDLPLSLGGQEPMPKTFEFNPGTESITMLLTPQEEVEEHPHLPHFPVGCEDSEGGGGSSLPASTASSGDYSGTIPSLSSRRNPNNPDRAVAGGHTLAFGSKLPISKTPGSISGRCAGGISAPSSSGSGSGKSHPRVRGVPVAATAEGFHIQGPLIGVIPECMRAPTGVVKEDGLTVVATGMVAPSVTPMSPTNKASKSSTVRTLHNNDATFSKSPPSSSSTDLPLPTEPLFSPSKCLPKRSSQSSTRLPSLSAGGAGKHHSSSYSSSHPSSHPTSMHAALPQNGTNSNASSMDSLSASNTSLNASAASHASHISLMSSSSRRHHSAGGLVANSARQVTLVKLSGGPPSTDSALDKLSNEHKHKRSPPSPSLFPTSVSTPSNSTTLNGSSSLSLGNPTTRRYDGSRVHISASPIETVSEEDRAIEDDNIGSVGEVAGMSRKNGKRGTRPIPSISTGGTMMDSNASIPEENESMRESTEDHKSSTAASAEDIPLSKQSFRGGGMGSVRNKDSISKTLRSRRALFSSSEDDTTSRDEASGEDSSPTRPLPHRIDARPDWSTDLEESGIGRSALRSTSSSAFSDHVAASPPFPLPHLQPQTHLQSPHQSHQLFQSQQRFSRQSQQQGQTHHSQIQSPADSRNQSNQQHYTFTSNPRALLSGSSSLRKPTIDDPSSPRCGSTPGEGAQDMASPLSLLAEFERAKDVELRESVQSEGETTLEFREVDDIPMTTLGPAEFPNESFSPRMHSKSKSKLSDDSGIMMKEENGDYPSPLSRSPTYHGGAPGPASSSYSSSQPAASYSSQQTPELKASLCSTIPPESVPETPSISIAVSGSNALGRSPECDMPTPLRSVLAEEEEHQIAERMQEAATRLGFGLSTISCLEPEERESALLQQSFSRKAHGVPRPHPPLRPQSQDKNREQGLGDRSTEREREIASGLDRSSTELFESGLQNRAVRSSDSDPKGRSAGKISTRPDAGHNPATVCSPPRGTAGDQTVSWAADSHDVEETTPTHHTLSGPHSRVWSPQSALPHTPTRNKTNIDSTPGGNRGRFQDVTSSIADLHFQRAVMFTPPVIPASKVGLVFETDSTVMLPAPTDSKSVFESQEEELDLMYDPILNFYYDPKTNKYYELL